MAKADLTAERLRELLHYDPETGNFTWLVSAGRVKAGYIAGYFGTDGYRLIRIDRRIHRAHRLAHLYLTGEWPAAEIDHINGIRSDNCWRNLREATHEENMQNRLKQSNNTSGFPGVCWNSERGKWQANIHISGRTKYLGLFQTSAEAYAEYLKAKRQSHPFCTL